MALIRVTVTVPHELVRAADRRARELARSRSWVVAEALRSFLVPPTAPEPSAIREPIRTPAYLERGELDRQRFAQLEADLRLTPEQRVLEAEVNARLGERQPSSRFVRFFTSWSEFAAYKRLADLLS